MAEICGAALHSHKCVVTCQRDKHPSTEPHEFRWNEVEDGYRSYREFDWEPVHYDWESVHSEYE